MEEVNRWASSWDNVTTLSSASITALILGTLAIFVVQRRFVFLPLLLVTSFVPTSERIVVAGMDFPFLRLMTIICWVRLACRSELKRFNWWAVDTVYLSWVLWRIAATLIRTGSAGALVRHLGLSIELLGIYFLVRLMVRSWRDLDAFILSFAVVAIPVAASMIYETTTSWNFASVFTDQLEGGVISREGSIRATCGYAHPLIAGGVWASMLPLIAARWWKPGASRAFTAIAAAAAVACVLASSSSTPLIGMTLSFLAAGVWVVRRHMNWVRWGILGAVVFLQMVMEKPIWHLFQRAGEIGLSGSTGYHRYRLFDAFVRHFTDWALIGLNSTAYWGRQLDDVTNVFIAQAVSGGLLGFSLMIAIFVMLFRRNGQLLRFYRGKRPHEIYLWALGVSLFTHIALMNAMGYLWQMQLPWLSCFALIAGAPLSRGPSRKRRPVVQRAAETPAADGLRCSGLANRDRPS